MSLNIQQADLLRRVSVQERAAYPTRKFMSVLKAAGAVVQVEGRQVKISHDGISAKFNANGRPVVAIRRQCENGLQARRIAGYLAIENGVSL